jgi:UDP-glucose 4-epimerase
MKYLVTGSHGFIGRNLCKTLLSNDHSLFTYDLKIGKDLREIDESVFAQVDAIYHLACINQEVAETNQEENWEINAVQAGVLAKAAKRHSIPLIYTSTASVYGNAEVIPTPVDTEPAPLSVYATAKELGESFIRQSGCKYKILRLSNVYGPEQTPENPYCGVIGKFVENMLETKPLQVILPGTQTRDFTYVDDVVRALLSNRLKWNSTYNVSRGQEISINELAMLIADNIEYIPPRSVDLITRRCLVSDFKCSTSLKNGLKKTIEWKLCLTPSSDLTVA